MKISQSSSSSKKAVKLASSGGASVLASRSYDCGIPKEHLKIAPHFRKSLLDFALFAVASIMLTALAATAQTTNTLSDAEIQGRQLAQRLLEMRPSTNAFQVGIINIRNEKGISTNLSLQVGISVSAGGWSSSYTAALAGGGSELLTIIHADKSTNSYSLYDCFDGWGGDCDMGRHLSVAEDTSFTHSDFWAYDLGLEFLYWPVQKILHGDTARGRLCKVLESTNPNPSPHGYSHVDSWIDNETPGILHAEAYDASGKLLKLFDPKSFMKVNGQWEVQDMEIRNVQTGSRTRLEFDLNK
jgi:hypothetical protein